jgi:hypothetical protein
VGTDSAPDCGRATPEIILPGDLSHPAIGRAISGVRSGGEKRDPSVMRRAGPAHRHGGRGSFPSPPVAESGFGKRKRGFASEGERIGYHGDQPALNVDGSRRGSPCV